MERRKFLGRLLGTAAAVIVAPSVFAEFETSTAAPVAPVAIEPVKETPPWLGLGLLAEMERRANNYVITGNERLINILDDLIAKDVEMSQSTTFFSSSFKPVKSRYHR